MYRRHSLALLGIAIGNIVGSSISNILLILGLSALITPMPCSPRRLRRDGVVVVFSALLFAIISYLGNLDRITGSIFVILLAAYLIYAYRQEKAPAASSDGYTAALEKAEAFGELHDRVIGHRAEAETSGRSGILLSLLMAIIGLAVVVLRRQAPRRWRDRHCALVRHAETVIGLTIVAVGTSMPEFVTSVVAAIRKHADVALGNIMGSNTTTF